MSSRREFLNYGFGAVAAGLMARTGLAQCPMAASTALLRSPGRSRRRAGVGDESAPVASVAVNPESQWISGLPFAPWFTGDDFPELGPTHLPIPPFVGDEFTPPAPSETVEVCIIGGGLSGLSSAYMLRDLHPVVLDVHERFGGAARGEDWAGNLYSLGNAYVITPDAGSFLDTFYHELGLDEVYRLSEPPDPIAQNGRILHDFWNGGAGSAADAAPYVDYAGVVTTMATELYPDIPFDTADPANAWILELDQRTFKDDIQERMTHEVPTPLEQAIQAYCFSSFGAGWSQISAAAGWNFLAAEEYGRWVFPGGTSFMAQALWQKMRDVEQGLPEGQPALLRPRSLVRDVRFAGKNVQVTYLDAAGNMQSLLARRVVMACPKFVAKRILHELEYIDFPRYTAMESLKYVAYVVANVLLNESVPNDFYDIFQLTDDTTIPDEPTYCLTRPVADVLNGNYALDPALPRSVLTLYWPVPGAWMRYCLGFDSPWKKFGEKLAPQIDQLLSVVGLDRSAIRQIRMSRWGHALPVAKPGLMGDGTIDTLRSPYEGMIYFVNQDNWSLPAVENSVLDAEIMTTQLRAGLS